MSTDSPKIICYSISVYEWDRHAEIKCDIWSKPDIKTLSWIIDSNGTTLSAGEVINDFWIDIKVGGLNHINFVYR